jgi:hypothetical protein
MAHNAASRDLHITNRFTTLRLIGGIDCVPGMPGCPYPDLDVRGGARIGKGLCVEGNLNVEQNVCITGDLKVLGNTYIKTEEIIVIKDKKICLADPGNVAASNITADGGGIVVRGPDPDESKSIIWYMDGPYWHFNQDINLGRGRTPFGEGCGGDTGLVGYDFRIFGNSVLNYTTLGDSVICSSLEKVGELREGSIGHYIDICAIDTGVTPKITTKAPHGLEECDNVRICDSNSFPLVDGCYKVTSIVSPTMFRIDALPVIVAGTYAKLKGVMFPIDIGTSTITSGTHCIQCSGNLVVKDNSGVERFKVIGATGKTTINYEEKDCALNVVSDYLGDYDDSQTAVCIDNSTNNNDILGTSCALDIQQCYYGTNTVYGNAENTVRVSGLCIDVKTVYKNPLVKVSARGQDIKVVSENNCGSNFGIYTEAGGITNVTHETIGIVAIANDGVVRIGSLGCINVSREDLATTLNNYYVSGGLHAGGYFCNPNISEGEYALYSEGRTCLNGPVNITGNVMFPLAMGNILIANLLCAQTLLIEKIQEKIPGQGVQFYGNVLPGFDRVYNLGSLEHKWNTIVTNDLVVCGKLIANIESNIQNVNKLVVDSLIANIACINDELLVDKINEKTDGTGVIVDGVELKDSNVTANVVCIRTKLYVDEIVSKSGNGITIEGLNFDDIITLNTLISNLICSNIVQTDVLKAKTQPHITVASNLVPSKDATLILGNAQSFWKTIYVNDIVMDGNLIGAMDIFTERLLSKDICTENIKSNTSTFTTANVSQLNVNEICGPNVSSPITITSNVIPKGVLSLGSPTNKWEKIYTNELIACNTIQTPVANIGTLVSNNVCITGNISVDVISEKTNGSGVLIDGVLHKDSDVIANTVVAEHFIGNLTGNVVSKSINSVYVCTNVLLTDVILEKNTGEGVSIEGVKIVDSGVYANVLCANMKIQTDVISEKTNGAGVTIDGVLLNNSNVIAKIVYTNIVYGNLEGNVLAKLVLANVVSSDLVCSNVIQVDTLESKLTSNVIKINSDIVPSITDRYNFGSKNMKWGEIVTQDLIVCGNLVANITSNPERVVANIVCVGDKLLVDVIQEKTANSGVTIDGVLIKDDTITSNVIIVNKLFGNVCGNVISKNIETNNLVSNEVCVGGNLLVDRIYEKTSNNGVVIDGVLIKDGNVYASDKLFGDLCGNVVSSTVITNELIVTENSVLNGNLTVNQNVCVTGELYVDQIVEKTANAGVIIEGVTHKDGIIHAVKVFANICATNIEVSNLEASDTILSNTLVSKIVCISTELYVDTISEKNGNAGVTIDGVIHKDGNIVANTITSNKLIGNLCGNVVSKNIETNNLDVLSNVCISDTLLVDVIIEKTPDHGVLIDGVLMHDSNVVAGQIEAIIKVVTNYIDPSKGTLIIDGNVNPSVDKKYNLGNLENKWNNITTNDLTVCRNAVIAGDLRVTGNTTFIHTENLVVHDSKIIINSPPLPGADAGIFVCRWQEENDDCEGDVIQDVPEETGNVISGTTNMIILAGLASSETNFYRDWFIKITSGEGEGQVRSIVSYDGGLRKATVKSAWGVIPDSTSTFALFPCKFIATYFDEMLNKWVVACTPNANVLSIDPAQRFFTDLCVADIDAGNLLPHTTLTHNIGSSTRKYNKLFVKDIELCGNINGTVDIIEANTLCLNNRILVDTISEKTPGHGIDILSNLRVDFITANTINADKINGNLCGNVMGKTLNIINGYISNLITRDITSIGNTYLDNVCVTGDLRVDNISEKTNGTGVTIESVSIKGNTVTADKFVGNVCGNILATRVVTNAITANTICVTEEIQSDTIKEKTIGAGVTIKNDVSIVGNITHVNTITSNLLVANKISSEYLCANNVSITNDLNISGNVCVLGKIQIDVLSEKTKGHGITIENNVNASGNVVVDGTVIANTVIATKFIGNICGNVVAKNITTNTLDVIYSVNIGGNVCVNGAIQVDHITEKTNGNGVNVDGVLIKDGNITTGFIFADKIFGDLCGNVLSTSIVTNELTVIGNSVIQGNLNVNKNVCVTGELKVDEIVEKTLDAGVIIDGVINKDGNITANKIYANALCATTIDTTVLTVTESISSNTLVSNTVCIQTELQVHTIVGKSGGNADGVIIEGVLVKNGNVTTNNIITATKFIGNVCGNVISTKISTIGLVSNEITTGNLTVFDELCVGGSLKVDTITEKNNGSGITIDSDVNIKGNLTTNSIQTNVVTSTKFIGNICGNVVSKNIQTTFLDVDLDVLIGGNVSVRDTVTIGQKLCVPVIQTDNIESKTTGNVLITGNMIPTENNKYYLGTLEQKWAHIYTQDITICGSINANVMNDLIDSDFIEANTICVNKELQVSNISEKNPGKGVTIDGVLVKDGTVTANKFFGGNVCVSVISTNTIVSNTIVSNTVTSNIILGNNLTITGNVCIGDHLLVDTIKSKNNGGILIENILHQNSNLKTTGIISADKFIGNLCGNVTAKYIETNRILVKNDADIEGNLYVTSSVCISDKLQVDTIIPKGNGVGVIVDGVMIKDNTIDSNVITSNIIVSGIGCINTLVTNAIESKDLYIKVNSNLIPGNSDVYSLGSINKKWKTIFANDLVVCGNLVANITVDTERIESNVVCAKQKILTDLILEKTTNAGVTIDGVLIKDGNVTATKFVGDLCGNINASVIKTNVITVDKLFGGNICINVVTANTANVTNIHTTTMVVTNNLIATNIQSDIITSDKFIGDLCGNVDGHYVTTDIITSKKVQSNVICSNVITSNVMYVTELFTTNIVSTTINTNTITANKFIGDLCGNVVATHIVSDILTSKKVVSNVVCSNIVTTSILTVHEIFASNITVTNVNVSDTVTSTKFIGDLCGNVDAQNITVTNITVNNIIVEGNGGGVIRANTIIVNGTVTAEKFMGEFCGNVTADHITVGNTITIGSGGSGSLRSGEVIADKFYGDLCGNVDAQNITVGNITVNNIIVEGNGGGVIRANTIIVNGTVTATKFMGDLCGNVSADHITVGNTLTIGSGGSGTLRSGEVIADKFYGDLCGNVDAQNITVGNITVNNIIVEGNGGGVIRANTIIVNGVVTAEKFMGDLCGNVTADHITVGNTLTIGSGGSGSLRSGEVIADKFYGDLCGNVDAQNITVGNITVNNIIVEGNGGGVIRANTIIVSGTVTAEKFMGDLCGNVTADHITVGNTLTVGSGGSGSLRSGEVIADKFYGDLCGNVDAQNITVGNITVNNIIVEGNGGGIIKANTIIVSGEVTADKFMGDLCGNVDAKNIIVNRLDVSNINVSGIACVSVLQTSIIIEKGIDEGVTIDGVVLKDGNVIVNTLFANKIYGNLCGNVVGKNVDVDNVIINRIAIINTLCVESNIQIDNIVEKTPGTGVTIDGVLIKDSNVNADIITAMKFIGNLCGNVDAKQVLVDNLIITGTTINKGDVEIEGNLCLQGTLLTDKIIEKTNGSGVLIEGVLHKNSTLTSNVIVTHKTVANVVCAENVESTFVNVVHTITTGNICVTNTIQADNIISKSGNVGVTVDGVVLNNSNVFTNIVTANKFIGNLCGNVDAKNITTMNLFVDNIDVETTLCINGQLQVNTINEKTNGSGVTIDGVLIKDNNILANVVIANKYFGFFCGNIISSNIVASNISAVNMCVESKLQVNMISEKTPGSGVTIEEVLIHGNTLVSETVISDNFIGGTFTGNVCAVNIKTQTLLVNGNATVNGVLCVPGQINTDIISEKTNGSGVLIDGVLHKNSDVIANTVVAELFIGNVKASMVNAETVNANVVCANVAQFNVIVEKHSGEGVKIESVGIKDGVVTANKIIGNICGNVTSQIVDAGLIRAANICVSGELQVDTIIGKTANVGVSIEGVIVKNSDVYANSLVSNKIIGNLCGNVIAKNIDTVYLNVVKNVEVNGIILANTLCITNVIQVDTIIEKTNGSGVTIDGVMHSDGNVIAKTFYGNINSNEVCTNELQVGIITGKGNNEDILIKANLIPTETDVYSLGTRNMKWKRIFTDDLTVCGNLVANITVDTERVEANVVCAKQKILTDLIIEKTNGAGVTIEGVLIRDDSIIANTITGDTIIADKFIGNLCGNIISKNGQINNLDVNVDLIVGGNVCISETLQINTIVEKTNGSGVIIEGVQHKNGNVIANKLFGNVCSTTIVTRDIVSGNAFLSELCVEGVIYANTIISKGENGGVTIDGVIHRNGSITANTIVANKFVGDLCGGNIQTDEITANKITSNTLVVNNLCVNGELSVDTIKSKSNIGVTIDGVLIKNGEVTSNIITSQIVYSNLIRTDIIVANTLTVSENVTVKGNICVNGAIQVDTIIEKTNGSGIIIEGVHIKDGNLISNVIKASKVYANICSELIIASNVIITNNITLSGTITANNLVVNTLCVTETLLSDTISPKSNGAGVTIDGVLHKDNVVIANVVMANKFIGNLCGNVTSKNIETNNLIVTRDADLLGNLYVAENLCVDRKLIVDTIVSKTSNSGVTVDGVTLKDGNINAVIVTANKFVGNLCGNVTSESIFANTIITNNICVVNTIAVDKVVEKTEGLGVNIDGVLLQDSNVTANKFFGNLCGNINVDKATIGNLTVTNNVVLNGNVCITETLQVNTIVEKTPGQGVMVGGVILSNTIVLASTVVSNTFIGGVFSGNLITVNTGNVENLNAGNVCISNSLRVDTIKEKSNGHGIVFDDKLIANVIVTEKIFGNLCGNVIAKNVVTNNLIVENVDIIDLTVRNACITSNLRVDTIYEKTSNAGVNVEGVLHKDGNVTGDIIRATKFYGDLCGGNVDVHNIVTDELIVNGNSCITGVLQIDSIVEKTSDRGVTIEGVHHKDANITSNVIIANKVYANICSNTIIATTISANNLITTTITTNDVIASNATITNVTITNDICVEGNVRVDRIFEKTNGSGVSVDGVLIKDGNIYAPRSGGFIFAEKVFANVCGNVIAKNIDVENLTINNNVAIGGNVVIDADLCVAGELQVGIISEKNNGSGVLVDGVLIKDSNIYANVITAVKFIGDVCGDLTSNIINVAIVCVTNELRVDVINEKSNGSGVTIDGVVLKDSIVTANAIISLNIMANTIMATSVITEDICVSGELQVNQIIEKTPGNGVMIDGVLMKDGNITVNVVNSNDIISNTLTSNIVCISNALFVDTIVEKSNGSGVTIDNVLVKDNTVTANKLFGNLCGNVVAKNVETNNLLVDAVSVSGNVVIARVLCVSGEIQSDIINSKGNSGVTIDGGVIIKNNTVTANKFYGDLCGNVDLINIETNELVVLGNTCIYGSLKVDKIANKTTGNGVMIEGVTINGPNIYSQFITAEKIIGNLCGNVTSKNIDTKYITVTSEANITKLLAGNVIIDYELCVPKITVDTIVSKTGTTVSVSNVIFSNSNMYANHIVGEVVDSNLVVANVICVNDEIRTNVINSKTEGAGVTIEGINVKGNVIVANIVKISTLCSDDILTNNILSKTANAGVTIEGVMIKDNIVIANTVYANVNSNTIRVNTLTAETICVNVEIKVDNISSKTANAGVTIDTVVISNGNISAPGTIRAQKFVGDLCGNIVASNVIVDNILINGNAVVGKDLCVTHKLLVNTITSKGGNSGVTIEEVLISGNTIVSEYVIADEINGNLIGNVCAINVKTRKLNVIGDSIVNGNGYFNNNVCIEGELQVDTIKEKTPGAGVIIDGVLIQDSNIFSSMVTALEFFGNVTSNKITVNTLYANVVCANGKIQVDTIQSKTANAGVVIDGVLIKDSDISANDVLATKFIGNLCGNVIGDVVSNVVRSTKIFVDNLCGLTTDIIKVDADMIPSISKMYTLGTMDNKWKNIYTNDLVVCKDATIMGNLTVNGNVTVIHTEHLIVEDSKIVINAPPLEGADSGIFICRWQEENNSCTGDVITDRPQESGNVFSASSWNITLSMDANGVDDFYNDWFIKVGCQVRIITDYDGATKTATIKSVWGNIPSGNVTYDLFPCKFAATYFDTSMKKWVFACTPDANVLAIDDDQRFFLDLCVNNIDSANVTPHSSLTYNLGSPDKKWNKLYVGDIVVCGNIEGHLDIVQANVICVNEQLQVDNILEKTAGSGVNVEGVLIKNGNITTRHIVTANKFIGNLCGNVDAKNITVKNLTLENDLTVSNLVAQVVFADKFVGNLCGNVVAKNIDVNNLTVVNELTVSNVTAININSKNVTSDKFSGNLCGNVVAKNIEVDNITIRNDLLVSNLTAQTVVANKFIGNLCGNVVAKNIDVDNITIRNDFVVSNLTAQTVVANKFIGNLCGNVVAKNIEVENITIGNDLLVVSNLTAQTIVANKFIGNLCGNVDAKNIHVKTIVIDDDLTVSNLTTMNIIANVVTSNKFVGNLCGNIVAKNIEVENITIGSDLLVVSNLTAQIVVADKFIGNVCGNVDAKTIHVKTITIEDDLTVSNLTVVMNISSQNVMADKFVGNLCGNVVAKNIDVNNITISSDLIVSNLIAMNITGENVTANKIYGNLCGNVVAKYIEVENIKIGNDLTVSNLTAMNLTADTVTAAKIIGNLCGNIVAKNIEVDNISITNDLVVSNIIAHMVTAAKFVGNLCGNVEATNIEAKTIIVLQDVLICGNLRVKGLIFGNLISNVLSAIPDPLNINQINANVICINSLLQTDTLEPKTAQGTIRLNGNLISTNTIAAEKFIGNLCGNVIAKNIDVNNITVSGDAAILSNLTATNINAAVVVADKFVGNLCGNVVAKYIEVDNITIKQDITLANVTAQTVTANKFLGELCGNVDAQNITVNNITINGDLTVSNITIQTVNADKFIGNVCGNVIAKNITVKTITIEDDLLVSNLTAMNINSDTVSANKIYGNVCGNITAKNIDVQNITIRSDVVVSNITAQTVTADKFVGDLCGNIISNNIEVDNIVVNNDLIVSNLISNNINADTVTADKFNGNLCGNIIAKNIEAKNIEAKNINIDGDLSVSNVTAKIVTATKFIGDVCGNVDATNITVKTLIIYDNLLVSNVTATTVVANVVTSDKFVGNLCGNVVAKNIKVENITIDGHTYASNLTALTVTAEKIIGNVCGNVVAKNIDVNNITVVGELNASNVTARIVIADKIVGSLCGNVIADKIIGNLCGNVVAKYIEVINITVEGELVVSNLKSQTITSDKFIGNLCGNVVAKNIDVNNLTIGGDLVVSNLTGQTITSDKFIGNVCGNVDAKHISVETVTASNITVQTLTSDKIFGNLCGNVMAKNIDVNNLTIGSDLTVANLTGQTITSDKFIGNLCGNVMSKNITVKTIIIEDDLVLSSNLTALNINATNIVAETITVGKVYGNLCGNVVAKNIDVNTLVGGELTVSNIIAQTITSDKIFGNVCGNVVAKNIDVNKITIGGDLLVSNVIAHSVTSDKFIGNLCGNVVAKNIEVDNIKLNNDLTLSNLTAETITAYKIIGNVCGNVDAKIITVKTLVVENDLIGTNITAQVVTADKFIGNLCGNVVAKNIDVNNLTISGDLSIGNLSAHNITADKFFGNVCGNVNAKNITVENLNIIANICIEGILFTDNIESKTTGNVEVNGNLIPTHMNSLGSLSQKWNKLYVDDLIVCGNVTNQLWKSVYLSTGASTLACNSKYVGAGSTSKKFVDVAIVAQHDITFKSITFSTIGTGGTFANATATLYTRSSYGVPTPTNMIATINNSSNEFNMYSGNVSISKGDTYSVKLNPGGGTNMSAAITLEYVFTL